MTFTGRQQAHLQSLSTLPFAPPPLTSGSLTTISIDNPKTRQTAVDNGCNLLLTETKHPLAEQAEDGVCFPEAH